MNRDIMHWKIVVQPGIFIPFLFLLPGCRQPASSNPVIASKVFDSIPSASALVVKQDTAFIISDDGTGVYALDLTSYRFRKIAVPGFNYRQYRQPKETKHDLEAACLVRWQGQEYLLALGSGSGGSARDSLLLMNTADHHDVQLVSVKAFYEQARKVTKATAQQWNIEGLALAGSQLLFANRGTNELLQCDADAFLACVLANKPLPPVSFQQLHLPSIDGQEARLSGMCTMDEHHLLFCASVEDTPDWTQDGPVLGSYVGIYSLKEKKVVDTLLLRDRNIPVKEKLESVEVLQNDGGGLLFIAVADNDIGTSNIFRVRWKAESVAVAKR